MVVFSWWEVLLVVAGACLVSKVCFLLVDLEVGSEEVMEIIIIWWWRRVVGAGRRVSECAAAWRRGDLRGLIVVVVAP